jgi:hypothetical protein
VKFKACFVAWWSGGLLIASMLALQACGGSTQPVCGPWIDDVTAVFTQITVSNAALQPPGCQVLATPGGQIVADLGGSANAQFGDRVSNIGQCSFHQLAGRPKPATFATRDPADALFTVTNGQADCTVMSALRDSLCGLATMYPDGHTTVGYIADCNNDPIVHVAVYRGGVTLSLGAAPASKGEPVRENDEVTADLATGKITHSVPQFTKDQISLFDVQLDALVGGVSFTDRNSLLRVRSLSPSKVVVAPNILQSQLGQNYGNVGAMCKQATATPVVFYPADLKASPPQLYGGVCGNKNATVYGVAIYRQTGLGFSGPYFKTSGGGSLVRTDLFSPAITLDLGAPKSVFAWNGSLGQFPTHPESAPSPGLAERGIYVLKFLYDLPPDTTPRIGFVAVSLYGAQYPSPIG